MKTTIQNFVKRQRLILRGKFAIWFIYQGHRKAMSLLLVLTLFIVSYAINLDEGVQSYINSLVVEFEKSPRESRFWKCYSSSFMLNCYTEKQISSAKSIDVESARTIRDQSGMSTS